MLIFLHACCFCVKIQFKDFFGVYSKRMQQAAILNSEIIESLRAVVAIIGFTIWCWATDPDGQLAGP